MAKMQLSTIASSGRGVTQGQTRQIKAEIDELVEKAARNCPTNVRGVRPAAFLEGGKFAAHSWKPSFQMDAPAGTARGQWESQCMGKRYRLDLQGYSDSNQYANWSVQTNGQNSVTVACTYMRVGRCFSQSQLIAALLESAEAGLRTRMD